VDVERREAGCAGLDEEAPELAAVLLGPDHGDVGDGAVGDPELGPVQDVRIALPPGARLHRARVGAMVGLGETEAPDLLARSEAREPLLLLRLGAVRVGGVHDEAGLDRRRRAEARAPAPSLLLAAPVR